MIKRLIPILLSLIFFIFNSAAFAAPAPIGMIISAHGKATAINKQKKKRLLKRRSKIYLHDKIVTQKNSKAQLRLNDNSVIVVQPSSEFYVSEFSFNKRSPRKNKYVGNIVKGALINISGQGKTENYKLNSPLVTIAFRGTGLATKIKSSRRNNVPINQDVYVFSGYVTVKNNCKNIIGICEPQSINIGIGQKTNAATVDMAGKIKTMNSSGLKGISLDATMTKQGGGITVRCKGK